MGGKMVKVEAEKPIPLATLLRPKTLDEVVGQTHLIGKGGALRLMTEKKKIRSSVLWGPPGGGKTSLIRAMAADSGAFFVNLDATKAGVKELRTIIDEAAKRWNNTLTHTMVFIDEIHRWSKSQQDVLLPAVEEGTLILFGATIENPLHSVNSTILSRSLVFNTKPLTTRDLGVLIGRVFDHYEKKLGARPQFAGKAPLEKLINRCSGDARKLMTVMELIVEVFANGEKINDDMVDAAIPTKHICFDARGNEHFDLAHAYQEAIQNSDGNSAIFWLAKWLASGEDPAYISRRMLITAFEDCASNPNAIIAATGACFAVERTGMPECQIPMGLATVVMAQSPRDKTGYYAIKRAIEDVANGETIHVPEELRAGTSGYVSVINKLYIDHEIMQVPNGQQVEN